MRTCCDFHRAVKALPSYIYSAKKSGWSSVHGAISCTGLYPKQIKPDVFPVGGLQASGNTIQPSSCCTSQWCPWSFSQVRVNKTAWQTLPAQSSWCDCATDVLCIMQKWGKLKLTWVTARLVFISLDKKWDIKKRTETSDLHTDLRTWLSNLGPDSEVTPCIPHSTAIHHIWLLNLLHQDF